MECQTLKPEIKSAYVVETNEKVQASNHGAYELSKAMPLNSSILFTWSFTKASL